MALDLLMAQGTEAFDSGQYDIAASAFERVLQLDHKHAEACLLLGSIYGEQGRTQEAHDLLSRAVEIDPLDISSQLALGHVCRIQGDISGAISAFTNAVKLDGNDLEALSVLAGVLAEAGQIEEALSYLGKAVTAEGAGTDVWMLAGTLAARDNKPQLAIDYFNGALVQQPGLLDALNGKVAALIDLQCTAEAAGLLEEMYQANPDNMNIASLLSGIRITQHRLSESVDLAGQAARSEPDNTEFQIRYAEALERRGDVDTAFDVLRPLLEVDRPVVGAVFVFARICTSLGMTEDGLYLLGNLHDRELSEPQKRIYKELDKSLQLAKE